MIVPQFWAEARLQRPRARDQKQITVLRFGWSDISQADAEQMARQRAREALDLLAAGQPLDRRERKTRYNGAAGLPIREEILEREGDVVVTRNSYGARCLNTPDVLFADVDFDRKLGCGLIFAHFAGLFAIVGFLAAKYHSRGLFIGGTLAAMILAPFIARLAHKIALAARPSPEQEMRSRLALFLQAHADWHVRLYRTPLGFRALVMHRTFDPRSDEVSVFFTALQTDRAYAVMCRRQNCFRARLTPKPWRIGLKAHLRPRPGVWPISPEKLPLRQAWVAEYEAASVHFAACQFVESFGPRTIDPKARAVQALHDRVAQAASGLPIA
jgi:hypothetical protein